MLHTISLNENHRFRALYARGRHSAGGRLAVYAMKNRLKDTSRMGITVSSKLGGAVTRNRVRRRLRECYRMLEQDTHTRWDIVIVARHGALQSDFAGLKREMRAHLRKLDIVRGNGPDD